MMNRCNYSMAPKRDVKGGFRVFSLSGCDAGVREYKKRRMHKKAFSGCFACRAKRVKVCLQLEGG